MTDFAHKKRICRKCLPDSTNQKDLIKTIEEHILALHDDDRVSPEELDRRLAFCNDCEYHRDIFCSLCGCYTPLRAAKKIMSCPDVKNPKW